MGWDDQIPVLLLEYEEEYEDYGDSSCYICGSSFVSGSSIDYQIVKAWEWNTTKGESQFLAAQLEAMDMWMRPAWQTVHRMILRDLANGTCRISGAAQGTGMGRESSCVPLNSDAGFIVDGHSDDTDVEPGWGIVRVPMLSPSEEPEQPTGLVGYPVHAVCWRLLMRCLGDRVAQDNLAAILDLLRKHAAVTFEEAKVLPWHAQNPMRPKPLLKLLQSARARGGQGDIQEGLKRPCRLSLPVEIQFMLLELLPPRDAIALEEAMGWEVGNAFWRSQIPDEYFEVKELWDENIGWRYLYGQLESVDQAPGLVCRRQILSKIKQVGDGLKKHIGCQDPSSGPVVGETEP
ncbi:hypothetical protein BO71DRAFT_396799 [Aspergillus ellipticus CBS 707.79]|uniref:Uncharacterized protein n=1 Tax=Aspergillus ellipticus CBS 707.79 TaxID=1448320 RepID=A0A319DZ11_9EURO|nr:hypothetical protein BO71DRAFT_396799 [Aspergillus ellipticus CBS 707.79]